MGELHAAWSGERRLVFWTTAPDLTTTVDDELPELLPMVGAATEVTLALPSVPVRRQRFAAYEVPISAVLPVLPALRNDASLSDSVRCWSMAARLALELAARHAVAPTVIDRQARWRTLLSRPEDRARFDAIVRALPVCARAIPTRAKGPIRLHTSEDAVRGFVDATVDVLYRQQAWPGPGRGWALAFAEALRGDNATFQSHDARFYGVPGQIAAWADRDRPADLRLGLHLRAPDRGGATFRLELALHPADQPEERIPMAAAWAAGREIAWGDRIYAHPVWHALQSLARAKRVFPPIGECLAGPAPRDLAWDGQAAWRFIADGARSLRDAGFVVGLPEAFAQAGSRRIRPRMRLVTEGEQFRLSDAVPYRWEVALGDRVLTGAEFGAVVAARQPVVQFGGDWVLLDPDELARLPEGLPREGRLDAATALRAILTGHHEGVPVVADDRLAVLVDALRNPPDRSPPAGLVATLRPYQQRGFSWLACLGDLGLGACLADDMGLGKTVQVIAHVLERRASADRPTLVVCPTSLVGNWQREIARFAPALRTSRFHGWARDLVRARRSDVVVTTYGILSREADALAAERWDCVVLDEAQAIKNPDSMRARAAIRLQANHRIAMTGTPVENRLDELWSLMRFLVPGLLGPRATFRRTVAIPVERFGDEEVAQRLRLGTSPFVLRRTKADPAVIQDLPDKIERQDYCTLTAEQAALYRKTAEDGLQRVTEATAQERRGQVLAMLTALKQICNHPAQYLKDGDGAVRRSGKLQRTADLVDAILEAGERALIFTQYREMGEILVGWLHGHTGIRPAFLHGGVSMADRDAMVAAFQDDPQAPPVLIISLRAGGVGLNLTRATHVIHYDRWWNPAVEDQATDRAYRIGQHRNVQVYKLVCQATLEERIDAMLEDKRALAESVVAQGERVVTELGDAALRALVALGDDAVLEDE